MILLTAQNCSKCYIWENLHHVEKNLLYFINVVFNAYDSLEVTSTYERNTLDRSFIILIMYKLILFNGIKNCYTEKSEKIAPFLCIINYLRCCSLKKHRHMIYRWKDKSV